MIATPDIQVAMRRIRALTIMRRIAKALLVVYGFIGLQTSLVVFLDLKDVTTLFLPGASPAWVVWRAVYFFIESVAFMALGAVNWRLERNDEYVRRTAPFLALPDVVFTRVSGPFRIVLIALAAGFVIQFIDETLQRVTIFAPAQLALWLIALVLLLIGVFPIPAPAQIIQGRKTIRGALLRAVIYTNTNDILDQRFGPRSRFELADQLAAEVSTRTNYVGRVSVMLTDPAVGDGRPFIINSHADGDSTLPSPQAQLHDLTIAALDIIHKSLGYEGRAAVSFVELPKVNGKYVGGHGTIYREGARVMLIPDSES